MTDKQRIEAFVIKNEGGFYFTGEYEGDMWDDEIHRALFVKDEPSINKIKATLKNWDYVAKDLKLDIVPVTILEGNQDTKAVEALEKVKEELENFENYDDCGHCFIDQLIKEYGGKNE